MADHCVDEEIVTNADVMRHVHIFVSCSTKGSSADVVHACTHIYGAQVVSYKCPLVQQARLALLLFE